MFNKKIAAVGLAAALSLGGISSAVADAGHPKGVPPQVSTVLSQLVTKGTITQAQADAITAALTAAAPAAPTPNSSGKPNIGGMGGFGGRGHMGDFGGGFGMNSAARQAIITSTLGITAAELKTARQSGKSLAQIAGTKIDALITALINYDSTQIDAAVTAGKLTAAQATTMKANLKTHVTNEVNNVRGMDDDHGMGAAPKIPSSGTSTNGAKSITKATVKKA
mgnify:CR=1 FL=1